MFRFVLASASEHPSLAEGQAPPGWLSPREQAVLERLTRLPRRRKWLMGRWAAKRLLLDILASDEAPAWCFPAGPGHALPLPMQARDVCVLNDEAGAPYAELEGVGRLALSLSISHRGELGLAAVTLLPATLIGADLEVVEPRDPALVRHFFTDAEAAAVARAGRPELTLNRIWSAKEAVLKALGVGLRLDTRHIEIGPEIDGAAPPGWTPLAVTLDAHLGGQSPGRLTLLWRDEGTHVLTVALLTR